MLRCLVITLGLVLAARGQAAEPYLVKDIDPFGRPSSSQPDAFAAVNGAVLFAATGSERQTLPSRERFLWRSDGTENGTFPVLGHCDDTDCLSHPELLAATPIGAFYVLRTEGSVAELWFSRSTSGDAIRLAVGIDPLGATEGVWVPELRRLFFRALSPGRGLELGTSDGTPAGTRFLELQPGPGDSLPRELVAFRGRVYFAAEVGGFHASLWSSDGTASGTKLVKDTEPGPPSGLPGPRFLTPIGGTLTFFAPTPGKGTELWRSDGTSQGTSLVTELVKGAGSPAVRRVIAVGPRAYIMASTAEVGQELWVTNGSESGTRRLTNLAPPEALFSDAPLIYPPTAAAIGQRLLFSASDGAHGHEPWITDGTVNGTRLIRDVCPGNCNGLLWMHAHPGERLLFTGDDGVHGGELWATDGSSAGTRLVSDLCAGPCSFYPISYASIGGRHLFLPYEGHDLWVTDGTKAGTFQVFDFEDGSSDAGALSPRAVVGNRLFFAAAEREFGRELWVTDGTPNGTRLVRDIADRDLGGSEPAFMRPFNGRLLFFADDGVHGHEPWLSDGTKGGTALIADVEGDDAEPLRLEAADVGERLLFTQASVDGLWVTDGTAQGTIQLADEEIHGLTSAGKGGPAFYQTRSEDRRNVLLWASDGTLGGTRQVMDLGRGVPAELVALGKSGLFAWSSEEHGTELWRSDGTPQGTGLLADLTAGVESTPGLQLLNVVGPWLYFLSEPNFLGPVLLWRTNGTAAGTAPIVEVGMGHDGDGPTWIAALGERLVVFLRSGVWVTDGTPAGTRHVSTTRIAGLPWEFEPPVAFGGKLYFGGAAASGEGLWRTDGTKAGTVQVLGAAGEPLRSPAHLRAFAGRLYFGAWKGASFTLFSTNGTSAGTRQTLKDGEPISLVSGLEVVGSRLFISGNDDPHGHELLALGSETP